MAESAVASTSTLPPDLSAYLKPPASPPAAAPLPSFYKRPLPESCIAFDSAEGKRLFKIALNEGYMEKYFILAQSFLTQNEPAYCGLATLCMCLNALNVDPRKQWKGPWRYFAQEMLDCCRTLDDVAKNGITLSEFACLARCNGGSGMKERTRYGTLVGIEEFERDIERVCGSADQSVMAVSYSRKTLGQTGDGHFSPVAGYCKSERKVLVLDVARFKYPSYWVSIDTLHAALEPVDKATGQPRGYSILSVSQDADMPEAGQSAGLLSLNFNKQSWPDFLKDVQGIEASTPNQLVSDILQLLQAKQITPLQSRKATPAQLSAAADQQQLEPGPAKKLEDAYDQELRRLITTLRPTPMWKAVAASLGTITPPLSTISTLIPPTLHYTLFLSALLSSSSAPIPLRQAWRTWTVQDNQANGQVSEQLSNELAFLQEQMDSLKKCCGSEAACACIGTGLDFVCKT